MTADESDVETMRSSGDVAALVSLLADGERDKAESAQAALVSLAKEDPSAVVSHCADALDVLAAVMVDLGGAGVREAVSRLGSHSEVIMTHMLARMAIAGLPGALGGLREATQAESKFVRDSAGLWLSQRFEVALPSGNAFRPPDCFEEEHATVRFWYKQGRPLSSWIRCPACGEHIGRRKRHAIQCASCSRIYTQASYQPVISRRSDRREELIATKTWRPIMLGHMQLWGLTKPWIPMPPGVPTLSGVGCVIDYELTGAHPWEED